MAMAERLRALYLAREALEHAHTALQATSASERMRHWARQVAVLIDQVETGIVMEEGRLAQMEADEAEGRARRAQEERE